MQFRTPGFDHGAEVCGPNSLDRVTWYVTASPCCGSLAAVRHRLNLETRTVPPSIQMTDQGVGFHGVETAALAFCLKHGVAVQITSGADIALEWHAATKGRYHCSR